MRGLTPGWGVVMAVGLSVFMFVLLHVSIELKEDDNTGSGMKNGQDRSKVG